jgi:hypothetical protein
MSSSLWVEGPKKYSTLEDQGITFLRNAGKHPATHRRIPEDPLPQLHRCVNFVFFQLRSLHSVTLHKARPARQDNEDL